MSRSTTLRRIIRNKAEYPWERPPRQAVLYQAAASGSALLAAFSRLTDAAEAATRSYSSRKERRESVLLYLGLARDYLRMAKP